MLVNSQLATNSSGSYYVDNDRYRAVTEFMVTGSIKKTSENLNIPVRTLYDWAKEEWWQTELEKLRIENKDLLASKLRNIVESGLDQIQDRIINGDAFLTKDKDEDGNQVDVIKRKPASLRDLGTVTGISFDKLRLINNEPTSISANGSKELQALAEQFAKLSNTKIIEGQCETKD